MSTTFQDEMPETYSFLMILKSYQKSLKTIRIIPKNLLRKLPNFNKNRASLAAILIIYSLKMLHQLLTIYHCQRFLFMEFGCFPREKVQALYNKELIDPGEKKQKIVVWLETMEAILSICIGTIVLVLTFALFLSITNFENCFELNINLLDVDPKIVTNVVVKTVVLRKEIKFWYKNWCLGIFAKQVIALSFSLMMGWSTYLIPKGSVSVGDANGQQEQLTLFEAYQCVFMKAFWFNLLATFIDIFAIVQISNFRFSIIQTASLIKKRLHLM